MEEVLETENLTQQSHQDHHHDESRDDDGAQSSAQRDSIERTDDRRLRSSEEQAVRDRIKWDLRVQIPWDQEVREADIDKVIEESKKPTKPSKGFVMLSCEDFSYELHSRPDYKEPTVANQGGGRSIVKAQPSALRDFGEIIMSKDRGKAECVTAGLT